MPVMVKTQRVVIRCCLYPRVSRCLIL